MSYNSSLQTLNGAATINDLVAAVNNIIPEYFESRLLYWRDGKKPSYWLSEWDYKLSNTQELPKMSVSTAIAESTPIDYATFMASLDQMFKIWSLIRNITVTNIIVHYDKDGREISRAGYVGGGGKALLTEGSYTISGRDEGYELSDQSIHGAALINLLNVLKNVIDKAPKIELKRESHNRPSCYGKCHSSCHANKVCHSDSANWGNPINSHIFPNCHANECHSSSSWWE